MPFPQVYGVSRSSFISLSRFYFAFSLLARFLAFGPLSRYVGHSHRIAACLNRDGLTNITRVLLSTVWRWVNTVFDLFDEPFPRTPPGMCELRHKANRVAPFSFTPLLRPATQAVSLAPPQHPFSAPFSVCNMNGMTRNCKCRFMQAFRERRVSKHGETKIFRRCPKFHCNDGFCNQF
jgi:hypothetical protein